jgi:septum formation protein
MILASASPRRRELVRLLGVDFTATSADIDETPFPGEPPGDYVRRLSRGKARTAAAAADGPALILAVDTTVVDGGQILGKPGDAAEARAMLRQLRGRVHHVYSALTLLDTGTDREVTQVAVSPVRMRDYSDEEIEAYIASGDPFDKAGAYAIQHAGFHPADGFDHCMANVMGLPLCHVARALRELGAPPPADIATACQAHIGYACPVYARILSGEE